MRMKKTAAILAVGAIVWTGSVFAKENSSLNKQVFKAKNVKIYQKQVLSPWERKNLEEAIVKGKPTASPDKTTAFTPLATGVLGSPLPEGGKRYALIIGMANYSGTAMDLCVADAKTEDQFPEDNSDLTQYCQDSDSLHLKQALQEEYGYNDLNSEIVLLRDGSATSEAIRGAMENLATEGKITANDEVVFLFSGHGVTGELVAGEVYDKDNIHEGILPYDYSDETGAFQPILDDELADWANRIAANRMIFIFDTCLAGGMNDLEGDNRILALSSGELQSSSTYYLGGALGYQESEGFFSHYFVKRGMFNYENKPDGTNLLFKKSPLKYDGNVSVEEAFSYAYPIVVYKQTPVLKDFNKSYDLLLGR